MRLLHRPIFRVSNRFSATRRFPLASKAQFSSNRSAHVSHTSLIEEELLPYYNANDFYPFKPGALFNTKYRIVEKLGFGRASNV